MTDNYFELNVFSGTELDKKKKEVFAMRVLSLLLR